MVRNNHKIQKYRFHKYSNPAVNVRVWVHQQIHLDPLVIEVGVDVERILPLAVTLLPLTWR